MDDCSALGSHSRRTRAKLDTKSESDCGSRRSHKGMAFGGVEPEGEQEQAKEGQEQLKTQAESALPTAEPPPPIRIVLGLAGELPPGSLFMGRSSGSHASLRDGVIHAAAAGLTPARTRKP